MPERSLIPLTPSAIALESPEFAAILGWPFADPYVSRLLRDDIPQRVRFNEGRVWNYCDPEGRLVGLGTIDVCTDYGQLTGGMAHPYIPLLAVNPTIKSLGFGTSIVRHLIGEAALLACREGGCHDILYLDVYTINVKAIKVYLDCGFHQVLDQPIPDPQENGRPYIVMAKKVAIAQGCEEDRP